MCVSLLVCVHVRDSSENAATRPASVYDILGGSEQHVWRAKRKNRGDSLKTERIAAVGRTCGCEGERWRECRGNAVLVQPSKPFGLGKSGINI